METKKLLWMIIALMLATTTAFSQGYGYGNRPGRGYGYDMGYNSGYYGRGYGYGMGYGNGFGNQAALGILNFIPGLTEEQKSKIQETEINHQKAMVELRVKEMSATDISERTKIRDEMLEKGLAHRDEIRNLLNDEQKEHYDRLWGGNIYGCMGYGCGCRKGRGCGGFRGRGRAAAPGGYGYRYGW